MNESKFIITEKQILDAVKYALELNIQESKIEENEEYSSYDTEREE